jgi:3-oxoacyl-[acyl-carrier-protein] synthase-3
MTRIITGTGSYLPGRAVHNRELEALVENYDPQSGGGDLDQWIRRHYGVVSRHWAAEGESTGDMAVQAAKRALESAGLAARDLDLIVMATATTDHIAPHSVSKVQAELGCVAVFHQLQDACPGFLNALMVADSLMENLGYRRALVVSAEKMTHIVDKRDFRMVGLFSDGAGALVLEDLPVPVEYGFQSFYAGSDGAAGYALRVPAGGTARPLTPERLADGEHFLISEYRVVSEFAVRTMTRCIEEASTRAETTPEELTWVVAHHASAKIVHEGAALAGVSAEQILLSIDHVGNPSSASVAITLDESVRAGKMRTGDKVLLVALGGGMGWGSTVYNWAGPEVIREAR